MYNRSLAKIHDESYAHLAEGAANFLRKINPPIRGPLVDLGCGAGNLLAALSDLIEVAYGFDLSPDMILRAKAKNPGFNFGVANLFDVRIPPAQVVTMIGEILSYACHGETNPSKSVVPFLNRIRTQLQDGGILLFDVLTDIRDYNYHHSGEEATWTLLMNSTQAGDEVTRKLTIFQKEPESGLYAKTTEYHHLKVFQNEQMTQWLTDTGFEVVTMQAYAESALPAGRIAYYCRKA